MGNWGGGSSSRSNSLVEGTMITLLSAMVSIRASERGSARCVCGGGGGLNSSRRFKGMQVDEGV